MPLNVDVLAPLVVESATLQSRVSTWFELKVAHDPRFCWPLTVILRPRHVIVARKLLSRLTLRIVLSVGCDDPSTVSISVYLPTTVTLHEVPRTVSKHVLPVPSRKSMVPEL